MKPHRLIAAGLSIFAAAIAHAQEPGSAGKGRAFAQRICAECHGVLPDDRISPRFGIATFKAIANTPGMTGTALTVWLQTPHKSMPNFIIEAEDRTNVIAYILSLRDAKPPL